MTDTHTTWRKTRHCGASNTCIEIAWRTSTRCLNESDCIQLADNAGAVLVRDSADPDGPRLTLTRETLAALLDAIKERP